MCDFAETYHIADYRALPARVAAALAVGLREDSRTKMRLAGARQSLDTRLRAAMLDDLNLLVWSQTKDGQRGRNRPESVLHMLEGRTKQNATPVRAFASAEAFEDARRKLLDRNGKEG